MSTDWKQTATELRERLDRVQRSILDKNVLRDTLLLRAQTAARRSASPEAREREREFRSLSSAYAAATAADASFADSVRRIELDGLAWSVPLLQPDDPAKVERAIGHQDFPYRVILQTRELAVGGAMIDIGANVGRMCIPRVILGDVSVAYCAEPDPLNYECLTRNVRDNHLGGLVLPDRVAVGAATGTMRFQRSTFAGGHRLIPEGVSAGPNTIAVPVVTLDDWVARFGIDLDRVVFVKVDVQGAEPQVLRGAPGVLARRHIAWQIEIDSHLLERGGASVTDLVGLVQRHFTHFIDLNRHAPGRRVRRTAELADALGYMAAAGEKHTDILACTLAGRDGA